MQTNLYFDKIWKHKHKRNKTRVYNKIIPQIEVKQTKGNGGFLVLFIPL